MEKTFFSLVDTYESFLAKSSVIKDLVKLATIDLKQNKGFGPHQENQQAANYLRAIESILFNAFPQVVNYPNAEDFTANAMGKIIADAFVDSMNEELASSRAIPDFSVWITGRISNKSIGAVVSKRCTAKLPDAYSWKPVEEYSKDTQGAYEAARDTFYNAVIRKAAMKTIDSLLFDGLMRFRRANTYTDAYHQLNALIYDELESAQITMIMLGSLSSQKNLEEALKIAINRHVYWEGSNKGDSYSLAIIQYVHRNMNHPGSYSTKHNDRLFDSIQENYFKRFGTK